MTKIYHAHLYGTRNHKYDWLLSHDVLSTDWQEIKPQAPFYLLIPQDTALLGEYEQGWKITEVMPVNSVGIVTARDSLTIHWTKEEAWQTVKDFAALDPEVARAKYNLGQDARDWKVEFAQEDLRKSGPSEQNLAPILYRPFDIRYTYYTGNSRGFHCMPRGEVMRNLHMPNYNLALITSRLTKGETFRHVQISQNIIEVICMSPKTSNNGFIFPLYLYPDRDALTQDRRANFSPEFLQDITDKLGYSPTPEAIFYYIYAVFHSPTYRSRYAEFLKIDFPRVPLTRKVDLFQQLAAYGEALVALHLMQSPKLDHLITQYEGHPDPIVDAGHPKFIPHPLTPSPKQGEGEQEPQSPSASLGEEFRVRGGKVLINKKGDGFTGVPEEVWNFYVGGYQVCQKWLKDRKGRTLSPADLTHYQRIVVALQETIRLMQQIDEAISGFPLE